jgi:hypothetical protein
MVLIYYIGFDGQKIIKFKQGMGLEEMEMERVMEIDSIALESIR